MIDEFILKNLNNKFTKELAKRNMVEAENVVKRVERMYAQHSNDSLSMAIYFMIRSMRVTLENENYIS